jgi:hypothetical protein
MVGWIKDGLVENDVMYIGGAWSIDHARRTAGVTWWADEECSIEQFNQIIDTYAVACPRVVITHDCPAEAAVYMFQKPGLLWGGASAKLQKTRTASALQAMYEIHQPDFWFFGHWHTNMSFIHKGCSCFCLDKINSEKGVDNSYCYFES